jgi:uncharacterized protein (TIGR02679 family)
MGDRLRLERTLGAPALSRLRARLVKRLLAEMPLTGRLTLRDATEMEKAELGRLLGVRPASSVDLDRLDRVMRESGAARSLEEAIQILEGPVVPRRLLQDRMDAERERVMGALDGCVHASEPWFPAWTAGLPVTRWLNAGNGELAAQAVSVLDLLPARSLPVSVLAERATGDTKALAPQEALSTQVLRALALWFDRPVPGNQEQRRVLWAAAGVIVDDLASQVLVLGLPADGGMVASWLTDAAGEGLPFRLTLQQLVRFPVTPACTELYVCENPAVLRAASDLGGGLRPLVCTEGIPSAACHELLRAATAAGVRVHWRADFDWAGLRIVSAGLDRYRAEPWRMGAEVYLSALSSGDSEPLRGSPAASPWEPALAEALAESGRTVMEERLLDLLLADLA